MTTKYNIDNVDFDTLYIRKDKFTDNGLWTWGYNNIGQLGTNSTTHRSSPVQTIAGGTNWKQVVCGYRHSAGIKSDGTLWSWGQNAWGQIGYSDVVHRSSPIQTIAGGTNWKQVACGGNHTLGIKTDGTLWTWGLNGDGQLGSNTVTNRSSPAQIVTGGTNWKQISTRIHTSAGIKTDGTLWMWGYNTDGQLGTNDTSHRSSPIQTVAGGTNWKQVSCNREFTTAIKSDGTLWSWGRNLEGQLGDNTAINKSSPVQTIAGGTNWKQVACGNNHTAAIAEDDINL